MKTTVKSQTDIDAKLTIVVEDAELKQAVSKAYDELRPRVKAAGFRPGKAPDSIIERELGATTVQSEVLEHAVVATYSKAVTGEMLRVLGQPKVSIVKFVPYTALEYEAEVELLPEAKLGDYGKIRLKRPEVKVEPSEIEATIEDLRRRQAVRIDSDRPAKLGDEVVFDFHGTKDGQDVPGASAKGHTLKLGSNQFIPGFEEQLVGLKAGDSKTFNITFPEDYQEASLKGSEVTFAVKVQKVVDLALPEVNQEFVASVSPFKSLDELKADIAERIANQKAEAAARVFEQKLLDKVLESSTYQTPLVLVQQQVQRLKGELTQNLSHTGLDLPKYLEMVKKTEAELEAEFRPEAEKRVGLALVLTAVAAAEKIELAADELDAEIARLKGQYPDPEMQAELDAPGAREEIYNHLMASRVIARLSEIAETK